MKVDKGFTIIELVVVIALLSVLSAVALPRFIDITEDAEDAVLKAGLSGFNTGLTLARSLNVAKGGKESSVVSDGLTFTFSTSGWPTPPTLDSNGCVELWNTLYFNADPVEVFGGIGTVYNDWVAFGNSSLCLYLRTNGEPINLAVNPYLIYYPVDIGATITEGTVLSFNFPE